MAGGAVGVEVSGPVAEAPLSHRLTRGQQRSVVVSVLRLAAGLLSSALLGRPEVGGPHAPVVLVWLVLSPLLVVAATAVVPRTRLRPRWVPPGRWTEPVVAVLDAAAFTAVATTSPFGYEPVAVLGLLLLAQAPLTWGSRGVALLVVPVTAVALGDRAGLVTSPGGRAALVAAVAAAAVLALGLRRLLAQQSALTRRAEATLALVFDHSPTPAAIACTTGTLLQVNAALAGLCALEEDRLVGRRLGDLVHPDDVGDLERVMGSVVAGGPGGSQQVEVRLAGTGGPRWARLLVGLVPAGPGVAAQVVVQAEDVEERRATTARLEHEATHDALTGLPNRRAVHRDLERLTTGADGARDGALVLLDLDGFKQVNDVLGHQAGDDLLVVVAERLRGALRAGEEAGRLAGDELVVLAGCVPGDEAARELGRRVTRALHGPARVGDGVVHLSASAGVRRITAGRDDPSSVLRDADAALYRAKHSGGGCWEMAGPAAPPGAGAPARQVLPAGAGPVAGDPT